MGWRWTPFLLACVMTSCSTEEGATGEAFDPGGTTASSTGGGSGRGGTGNTSPDSSTTADPTTSTPTTATPTASGGDSSSTGDPESSEGEGSTGVESDCPRVRVTVGVGLTLNVRPDPSTVNPPIGSLADGALVDVIGQALGESIDGEDLWYEIDNGVVQGFVLSSFVTCTTEDPPDIDPNGWYLPLPCGVSAEVTQGNNGALSHNGTSAFAFDFGLPLGSPLVAIAGGVVTHASGATGPGDPCYNGGGMECINAANYVTLLHADGTKSVYLHLQSISVGVGDTVPVGAEVGLSGTTGWSTGRHAHVMRMQDCGGYYCQSVALAFNDVGGDGVPVSGDVVTSGNCP